MNKTSSKHPNRTIIYAPGKIVLAGEYAVLDGCPSVVLSINRGVQCLVQDGKGIHTPNNDDRFVIDALKEAKNQQQFVFSSWNPVENIDGHKPGFGGSAAACVASCLAAQKDPHSAFEIHKRVQGSGSGVDIASSIHGGMIRYYCDSKSVEHLSPFAPLIIWSKRSAKTGPRVQKYNTYSERAFFVKESTSLVEQFTQDPIEVSNYLFELLCNMAKNSDIAYLTPEIEDICTIVRNCFGGAKPSGAGGGDCVVAFFKNEVHKEHCRVELLRQNYKTIDYKISSGAHILLPEALDEYKHT
jgi:mevalonate kinase